LCKLEGIYTAIKIAFNAEWSEVEKILPYLDFIMTDIKKNGYWKTTVLINIFILENLWRII